MLRGIVDIVGGWLSRLRLGGPHRFSTVFAEDLPDELQEHTVYILGEREYLWYAAMLCPCGCGETLYMSLHASGRPKWYLTRHSNGTISLYPSIRRTCGCLSHFFFQRGYVRWCRTARTCVSRRCRDGVTEGR